MNYFEKRESPDIDHIRQVFNRHGTKADFQRWVLTAKKVKISRMTIHTAINLNEATPYVWMMIKEYLNATENNQPVKGKRKDTAKAAG